MSAKRFILDTSALLAWIEGEEGAERVRLLLSGNDEVLLPWAVLMETFYITAQESGEEQALRRYAALKQLPIKFLDTMDEPVLLAAGRLKANHRISFADAVIAAFALRLGATLVHKDPEYAVLNGQLQLEALPYKS